MGAEPDERRAADDEAPPKSEGPTSEGLTSEGLTSEGLTSEAPPTSEGPTSESAVLREWRKKSAYLSLFDFASRPASQAAWVVRALVIGIALYVLVRRVGVTTEPLLATKPAPPIPTQEIEDYRFRMPERTRREIFMELATAELAERARAIAANTWTGHAWSREDDRGHYERVAARAAAAKYGISLTQTYLVLDEGLREHWPGPDGNPLPATTPPLSIRSTW